MASSSGSAVNGSPIPVPAHDPIAIAALVAELPELEAKFAEAMKHAEEANKALDVIQDRIDQAINVLRSKAPRGSKWNSRKAEMTANEVNMLRQQFQQLQSAGNAAAQNQNWAGAAQNNAAMQGISPPIMMIKMLREDL